MTKNPSPVRPLSAFATIRSLEIQDDKINLVAQSDTATVDARLPAIPASIATLIRLLAALNSGGVSTADIDRLAELSLELNRRIN